MICIQCLYTQSWLDIAKIVVPNIIGYCQKHGYSWNIQCISEPYDAFEKIRQIQGIFQRNEADVVMSMDCDAIITNYTVKIEDFIKDKGWLFLCKDYNGINCGVFIVVNNGYSKIGLDCLLAKQYNLGVYCEQDALDSYLKVIEPIAIKYNYPTVEILPHSSINSYKYELYPEIPPQTHEQGQWQEGDFVLHLPGIGMEKRKEILENIKIIYE